MKPLLSRILPILAATALMASCSESDAPATGASEGERTVLVYMVAANSLGVGGNINGENINPADEDDIAEMIRAAHALTDGRRVLVMRSTYSVPPTLYELKAEGLKPLRTYDETESVLLPEVMRGIIDDARELAPARHLGLVLWSHADGWLQGTEPDKGPQRSFGVDRSRRMSLPDLREAIDGADLEYLYFDCCLMASVEVAYELRHTVPYIVASTSELPRPGMPYDITLPMLLDGAPAGITDAAASTYGYYRDHINPVYRTCTISVVSTDGLDDLAAATRAVYDSAPLAHPLRRATNYNGISNSGYHLDMGEYVLALADGRDAALASDFTAALDRTVVYKASTDKIWSQYPVYHDSGLSTYVFTRPDAFTVKGYDTLAWARDVVATHIKDKQ